MMNIPDLTWTAWKCAGASIKTGVRFSSLLLLYAAVRFFFLCVVLVDLLRIIDK